MAPTEPIWDEEKEKQRLLKTSKLLFLLIIIYCLGIALIIIGTYFFQFGEKWAFLTGEQWILSAIFLIKVLLPFELVAVTLISVTLPSVPGLARNKPFCLTHISSPLMLIFVPGSHQPNNSVDICL